MPDKPLTAGAALMALMALALATDAQASHRYGYWDDPQVRLGVDILWGGGYGGYGGPPVVTYPREYWYGPPVVYYGPPGHWRRGPKWRGYAPPRWYGPPRGWDRGDWHRDRYWNDRGRWEDDHWRGDRRDGWRDDRHDRRHHEDDRYRR